MIAMSHTETKIHVTKKIYVSNLFILVKTRATRFLKTQKRRDQNHIQQPRLLHNFNCIHLLDMSLDIHLQSIA